MPPVHTGTRPGAPTRSRATIAASGGSLGADQPAYVGLRAEVVLVVGRAPRLLGTEGHEHDRHRVPASAAIRASSSMTATPLALSSAPGACGTVSRWAPTRTYGWPGSRSGGRATTLVVLPASTGMPHETPCGHPEGLLRHVVAQLGEPVLDGGGGGSVGVGRRLARAERSEVAHGGHRRVPVECGVRRSEWGRGLRCGGRRGAARRCARTWLCRVVGRRRAVRRTAGERGRQHEAPVRRRVGSPHHRRTGRPIWAVTAAGLGSDCRCRDR